MPSHFLTESMMAKKMFTKPQFQAFEKSKPGPNNEKIQETGI